jgi:murein DD-endopeptidase MepM/ murein hydrolase activator NlpD
MGTAFSSVRRALGHIDLYSTRGVMVAAAALFLVMAAAFFAGRWVGASSAIVAPDEQVNAWNAELARQKAEVARVRRAVEEQVDTLAIRVGQMNARLLRLDALGKRLTEVANLKRGEFDFDAPPAMGGPEIPANEPIAVVPELNDLLERLSVSLDDRERQLGALESLILARELSRQIVPGGRPVFDGYVSSPFGYRADPITGRSAFHSGRDFAGPAGSQVLAVATGVVTYAGRDGNYGQLVEITHGNGYVTRYAHNQRVLVAVGETVQKGNPIALMGNTGRSTGTHLHFEVLRDGAPVNPLAFLPR